MLLLLFCSHSPFLLRFFSLIVVFLFSFIVVLLRFLDFLLCRFRLFLLLFSYFLFFVDVVLHFLIIVFFVIYSYLLLHLVIFILKLPFFFFFFFFSLTVASLCRSHRRPASHQPRKQRRTFSRDRGLFQQGGRPLRLAGLPCHQGQCPLSEMRAFIVREGSPLSRDRASSAERELPSTGRWPLSAGIGPLPTDR